MERRTILALRLLLIAVYALEEWTNAEAELATTVDNQNLALCHGDRCWAVACEIRAAIAAMERG